MSLVAVQGRLTSAFWVFLSFAAMHVPAVACFSKLKRDKRHVYRHAQPVVQYTFFGHSLRRMPSSWVRFLWFMACLAIASFSVIAGQAYASLFLSTLPHTSLDAGTWVWSWIISECNAFARLIVSRAGSRSDIILHHLVKSSLACFALPLQALLPAGLSRLLSKPVCPSTVSQPVRHCPATFVHWRHHSVSLADDSSLPPRPTDSVWISAQLGAFHMYNADYSWNMLIPWLSASSAEAWRRMSPWSASSVRQVTTKLTPGWLSILHFGPNSRKSEA